MKIEKLSIQKRFEMQGHSMKSAIISFCFSVTLMVGLVIPIAKGMSLVWSDNFTGGTLDSSKWTVETGDGSQYGIPGWGNQELQWYKAENCRTEQNNLVLTAIREQVNNYSYTSCRLITRGKFSVRYGRIEARIKLPGGQGLWPAFWMLPEKNTYGTWAASGEIDIMEAVNLTPGAEDGSIHGTIHYGGAWPDNVYTGTEHKVSRPTEEYHVYAVEWQEGKISWYVDGVLYGEKSTFYSTGAKFPAPFNQKFYLLLNVAVGGSWPGNPGPVTKFPVSMKVDYVRVYQSETL